MDNSGTSRTKFVVELALAGVLAGALVGGFVAFELGQRQPDDLKPQPLSARAAEPSGSADPSPPSSTATPASSETPSASPTAGPTPTPHRTPVPTPVHTSTPRPGPAAPTVVKVTSFEVGYQSTACVYEGPTNRTVCAVTVTVEVMPGAKDASIPWFVDGLVEQMTANNQTFEVPFRTSLSNAISIRAGNTSGSGRDWIYLPGHIARACPVSTAVAHVGSVSSAAVSFFGDMGRLPCG